MEIVEEKFQDKYGNETWFTRKEFGEQCEVIFIEFDNLGNFISHKHYFYRSEKLQEWLILSESGDIVSRNLIEYGSNVWDAWHREFDCGGKLIKQIFHTWEKSYDAKAEFYYDGTGNYLGKKVHSLKDGKYQPLVFDKEDKLILLNYYQTNSNEIKITQT